jgi:hypothetical protein
MRERSSPRSLAAAATALLHTEAEGKCVGSVSRREIDCKCRSSKCTHWQDKRRTEEEHKCHKSEAIRISKSKSRASKSRAKTKTAKTKSHQVIGRDREALVLVTSASRRGRHLSFVVL